ncbi:ran-binding protein 10 [Paenibacillus sp. KS1]|uniref:ran-binding protein 10 n=1 Tax=Paenibacillus sp. KS1 TaxID=1849249 RepID=UPI000A86D9BF|nr:ran-binding protein 10 [Paenibacillus sp. KS1]
MKKHLTVLLVLVLLVVFPISAFASSKVDTMEGLMPPKGTTVVDSNNLDNETAMRVIDGDLNTQWGPTSDFFSGSLEITFPQALTLKFVQVAGNASPMDNVTYQIFAYKNGTWEAISKKEERWVSDNATDPISVTPGNYEKIKITVNGYSSWVAIKEITFGYELNEVPDPEKPQRPDPTPTNGDRALLVVTMTTGLEKEFDLSMDEVNAFIAWYENKQAGSGTASYAINKHNNNQGPFSARKDYVIFDKILTFEVNEYTTK